MFIKENYENIRQKFIEENNGYDDKTIELLGNFEILEDGIINQYQVLIDKVDIDCLLTTFTMFTNFCEILNSKKLISDKLKDLYNYKFNDDDISKIMNNYNVSKEENIETVKHCMISTYLSCLSFQLIGSRRINIYSVGILNHQKDNRDEEAKKMKLIINDLFVVTLPLYTRSKKALAHSKVKQLKKN